MSPPYIASHKFNLDLDWFYPEPHSRAYLGFARQEDDGIIAGSIVHLFPDGSVPTSSDLLLKPGLWNRVEGRIDLEADDRGFHWVRFTESHLPGEPPWKGSSEIRFQGQVVIMKDKSGVDVLTIPGTYTYVQFFDEGSPTQYTSESPPRSFFATTGLLDGFPEWTA